MQHSLRRSLSLRISILTLFPEMFTPFLQASIIGKAQKNGIIEFAIYNIRDFSVDKHKRVDDSPFGGGAGMVMTPQPIFDAIHYVQSLDQNWKGKRIYMSPQGSPLHQAKAYELSCEENIIILCGHYEGVDERVLESVIDDEISIGDYILTGGELPAMILSDCISRLVPGVLGKEESHQFESFSDGLLEHPHYTRPQDYDGKVVPDVLLNGHHALITKWRRQQSLLRTFNRRCDLLEKVILTPEDKKFISELRKE